MGQRLAWGGRRTGGYCYHSPRRTDAEIVIYCFPSRVSPPIDEIEFFNHIALIRELTFEKLTWPAGNTCSISVCVS